MKKLELWPGFPPTANKIWRNVGGRVLASKDYRQWKTATMNYFVSEAMRLKDHSWLESERLRVEITLTPNTRHKWDIDNRVKPLLDALQAIIGDDERIDEIVTLRTRMGEDRLCRVLLLPAQSIQPLTAGSPRT